MTHTRWIVGTLLVTLGAMGMGGCYYDFSDEDDDARPSATAPGYGGGSSSSSSSATRWSGRADTFRGDLGTVEGFDGTQATLSGTDYATSSSVRIDAENTEARWWAMTQLSISGSLRHPSLVPGAHLVFNRRDRTTTRTATGAAPLFMSVLGCSGPRLNQFTYDQGAEEVTVDVSAGPTEDTRRLSFDAKFNGPTGEQHVTGSFLFEPQ
ncbi:MAG: hypothetical protein Q8S73_23245 [Deltaproteobacteria bacterium]|nr:hypothetical protein [Myxococcales bacterium]MDP3217046.1 hypothetical protein [Deltaproteobacteria bacterium]